MSKVLLENYRGFEIMFETKAGIFLCEVSDTTMKEGSSFSAIKAAIDSHIKENGAFEPFWAESIPSMYGRQKRILVVGIRKDSRFIIEESGKKSQLSDYDLKDFIIVKEENKPIINEILRLGKERSDMNDMISQKVNKATSMLSVTTLKEVKDQLVARQ